MQDAGGFFDLILTEAANMANSVPEMFDPLAAIGMHVASACLLVPLLLGSLINSSSEQHCIKACR